MNGAEHLHIRSMGDGAAIAVKVVPGASRDRLMGVLGECMKVATSAAPEKGKANQAVAHILARAVGVDRRDVLLVSGSTSPRKVYLVRGLSAEVLRARLAGL